MILVDVLILGIVRALFALLNLFPIKGRIDIVEAFFRAALFFVPSYRAVCFENLERVYPHESEAFRNTLYAKSIREIARLVVDFGRLPSLDEAWVDSNVIIDADFFKRLQATDPSRPILCPTGHLGSFELLAHAVALKGTKLNFIVRNFNLPRLDEWWTKTREHNGNRIIPRKGAVQRMLQLLGEGQICALLFDQNVKRNYALFVPWFGIPAATTFAMGYAAVKTNAFVVVSSIKYHHDIHKYEVVLTNVPCEDIYADLQMSHDDKVLEVTNRASRVFEQHILGFPEGWFWMHRRWKTRPEQG